MHLLAGFLRHHAPLLSAHGEQLAHWRVSMTGRFLTVVATIHPDSRKEFDMKTPPASLIGVDVLFEPGIMVEAEVTAVIN